MEANDAGKELGTEAACYVESPSRLIPKTRVDRCIEEVKKFTYFYTNQVTAMYNEVKGNQLSMMELQILRQINSDNGCTVKRVHETVPAIGDEILTVTFEKLRQLSLLSGDESGDLGEESHLRTTDKGKQTCSILDAGCRSAASRMLKNLSSAEQNCVVDSMRTIQQLLSSLPHASSAYKLRSHQPGDIGWMVHRHGVLYSQEYGWNEHCEAFVAQYLAKFIQNYNEKFDRCFIAERNNETVGSVVIFKEADGIARLRFLLVEPSSRGLGIGTGLVQECISFAKQVKYNKIILWTQSILNSALTIYGAAGFVLIDEEPHNTFGYELMGQTWELKLQ